ncbi:MarC family protein [Cardiobacterium hominis]|jgi:membrane protein, marC family|uniref:MarC family protein n=1 Tax=Cardiobacterium hominis TaxID=2718 RepID=UPI0028E6A90C|nr:MarC family protein [Cardiobacterium hominis]
METLWATAITLFLIMDPLGNVPIFLIVLERVAEHRRRYIILRELIIALIVMLLFLFAGPAMLRTLGISPEAVAIAGGLVLLIIAIRMIFPLRGSSVMGDDDEDHGEPLLVPLAIPLLAGPSLLATLMLRANSGNILQHTLPALLLAWAASAVILLASPFLYRIFGNRGLKAMERLMGMVLICISVQMLLNAFARVLH